MIFACCIINFNSVPKESGHISDHGLTPEGYDGMETGTVLKSEPLSIASLSCYYNNPALPVSVVNVEVESKYI